MHKQIGLCHNNQQYIGSSIIYIAIAWSMMIKYDNNNNIIHQK